MTKYFCKKMHIKMHFLCNSLIISIEKIHYFQPFLASLADKYVANRKIYVFTYFYNIYNKERARTRATRARKSNKDETTGDSIPGISKSELVPFRGRFRLIYGNFRQIYPHFTRLKPPKNHKIAFFVIFFAEKFAHVKYLS